MGKHYDGLDLLRSRAKTQLKDLRSDDPARMREAAEFFAILPYLPPSVTGRAASADVAPLSVREIVACRNKIRLKHALNALAMHHGQSSWADLVTARQGRLRSAVQTRPERRP